MERWDFDCQKCDKNIGDAWYVDREWYQCKKEREAKDGLGLKDHEILGRGRGRLGYCFCSTCAAKLDSKCPVCGSELVKIKADQHPGGHWGIRGGRKPAPMRPW